VPYAGRETAKDRELEYRRAGAIVLEPPERYSDMRRDRRNGIVHSERTRMQVEWDEPGERISNMGPRQAQHGVAVGLIRQGSKIAQPFTQRTHEFIALMLVRRKPRAGSGADESHILRRSALRPLRLLEKPALAHTLGQRGGPALPNQHCGKAQ
jgi:hypothetical protein